jgi:hypothetical protein
MSWVEDGRKIAEMSRRIVEDAEQIDRLTAERDKLRADLDDALVAATVIEDTITISRQLYRALHEQRNQLRAALVEACELINLAAGEVPGSCDWYPRVDEWRKLAGDTS